MGTGVTLDGTWQKRGFTSYNGAVMAIACLRSDVISITLYKTKEILHPLFIERGDSPTYDVAFEKRL